MEERGSGILKTLEGQTAVVTGGSRGIGRAIVLELARRGADVVINYRGNAEAAEQTAEDARTYGVTALTVQADISTEDGAGLVIAEALKLNGKIDILVNNAGITKDTLMLRMKESDFDAVLHTNLYGAFYCMKAVSRPMMKARYGRIISISSIVGLHGNPGQANYAAAKAGLIGMTKSLARELAGRGVTVNAVAPGMIETDMTDAMTQEAHQAMEQSIPMGHMGTPEDIANAAAFLADPASGYITGQVLTVDGGLVC